MTRITSAKLVPYTINGGGFDIHVTFDAKPDFSALRYEKRSGLYRAQDGDLISFYAYTTPGTGFGGARIPVTMVDDTEETLIGPWSSRAGVVNAVFNDRDHAVEVQCGHCIYHVTMNSLVAQGIHLCTKHRWEGEIYHEPIPTERYFEVEFTGYSREYNRVHDHKTIVLPADTADKAIQSGAIDLDTRYDEITIHRVQPFIPREWA